MSDNQQTATLSQHLLNSNSALNDNLTEALKQLTIGDDLKEYIDRQLVGIKRDGGKSEYKVRDLETYDGEKKKLRSWLTAADLQMYNKSVEGDERKVRFVSGYFRDRAWDWFEPIARETNNKPKTQWSDRTTRIMGS